MHKNYDAQIQLAWNTHKNNLRSASEEVMSNYGYLIKEVKYQEAEILKAIEALGKIKILKFIHGT